MSPDGTDRPTRQRRKPVGRYRVAFQVAVYALLGLHIAGWYLAGIRGVGTVSPNGLFYLAQIGLISAGLVLVVGALVAVLFVGNGFCGWACHFGAAQDFALWLMRRLGIRPLELAAPFRLRALLLVKLLVINTALAWLALGALPELFVAIGAPEPCFAIGTWITIVLDVFVLAFLTTWVFGPRAFCRVLCPVILLVRVGNLWSKRRMRLAGRCVDCRACDDACPMRNPVSTSLQREGSVSALDCVRCGRCRDSCPVGVIEFGSGPTVPRARIARAPRLSATLIGGLAGLVAYEAIVYAAEAGVLSGPLAAHLPNWELFYAALGMCIGALVARKENPCVAPEAHPRPPAHRLRLAAGRTNRTRRAA